MAELEQTPPEQTPPEQTEQTIPPPLGELNTIFAMPQFRQLPGVEKIKFLNDYPEFKNLQSPKEKVDFISSMLQNTPMQPKTTDWKLEALPTLGGAAGGMAGTLLGGGVGAIPGAMIGGAGGKFLEDIIRSRQQEKGAPQTATEFAKSAAIEGGTQGAYELTGLGLAKVFSKALNARRLYQSALKPTLQGGRAVEAGIEEGIPLTAKAGERAAQRIDQLNNAVERVINNAPADISPASYVKNVQNRFDVLRQAWGKDPTKARTFLTQIDEAERQFLIEHGNVKPVQKYVFDPSAGRTPALQRKLVTIEPKDMTLADLRANAQPLATGNAQAIKKQAWKTIRSMRETAFDPHSHVGLSIELEQEAGRAMMQELEKIHPALRNLNRREGAVINLEEQLQRWTHREMNRKLAGFALPVMGAVAGGFFGGGHAGPLGMGVGGSIGGLAGEFMREALESPAVKSYLAIALDRAARVPGAARTGKILIRQAPRTAAFGVQQMSEENQ